MQPAKSYKVLIVEDEGLIALDIASRLESLGHHVLGTVSTALEAVEQAGQADLVLMDIRIDGPRDGIDAAREIRAHHQVPVVFLTAHADRATLERAKLAGPFGYLVKPLGPAALQTAIEMAVYKHRVERQLEEREAWLRTTLASAADAIVVADPAGRIRTLNRAAETLTGWTDSDAQGHRIEDVVRLAGEQPGSRADDPSPLAILRGSPVALSQGARLLTRDGAEISVEGMAAPVLLSTEAPSGNRQETIGVVLSLRDVSGRRWEERQFRQSQRMEASGRLAAHISGEYASLIELIRYRANDLMQQFGEYLSARQAIEQIRQAADAADRITQRLAGFGSRQAAKPEVLSINAMLRRMAKLIESTGGSRIATSIRPDPASGRIKADSSQIEQAIMNLVLHACSTMPEGGSLKLETAHTELGTQLTHYVVLGVEYSATEPNIETLFDPAEGEGGLSLSMAHSIAAEHAGYLTARATPGGTRVELLLPQLIEEQPAPALREDRPALSILLVDPRDQVRAQLHNFFESAGYNLLEASDQDEALALGQMHEGPLDLVIADQVEAGNLYNQLSPSYPGLQALALTDGGESSPHELHRPFTQKTLLDRVETLLSTSATATSS